MHFQDIESRYARVASAARNLSRVVVWLTRFDINNLKVGDVSKAMDTATARVEIHTGDI